MKTELVSVWNGTIARQTGASLIGDRATSPIRQHMYAYGSRFESPVRRTAGPTSCGLVSSKRRHQALAAIGRLVADARPGFCGCGCGGQTPVSRRTDTAHGILKGQPMPFLKGHAKRLRRRS